MNFHVSESNRVYFKRFENFILPSSLKCIYILDGTVSDKCQRNFFFDRQCGESCSCPRVTMVKYSITQIRISFKKSRYKFVNTLYNKTIQLNSL